MEKAAIESSTPLELDTQKDKYLTFMLGEECYAIEISLVTEIIGIQRITQVPELPDYVKGIINLRGKIIPVMDVRMRFRKDSKGYSDRTCIIVVEIKNIFIGLIVDSVAEVIDIPDGDIITPPTMGKTRDGYIKAIGTVGKEVKLILDCGKLLNDGDYENIIFNQE